ncbi:MAG: thiol-disulfide oxidoreductase [Phenylobacterium zucineum]|nr:MAG: thiol-disulfide oxidoreductase [Phenylobacterium zucineum]
MPQLTVWYDGDCPLCVREIALIRRLDWEKRIEFENLTLGGVCPVDRAILLARFHAREGQGPLLSGAAAFAAMWRMTPLLRPFGLAAKWPPILWGLELAYRLFLGFRPRLQRLVRLMAPQP